MWKFAVLLFCLPLYSFAQKSVIDCESELDARYGPGRYDRSQVSACLFESVTTPEQRNSLQSPPGSSVGKSAVDCENELDLKYGLGRYDRSAVSACLFESLTTADERRELERKSLREPGVYIADFGVSDVNSVGGVEPYVVFVNPNKSSNVKYVYVEMILYNAVGDVVSDDISGRRNGRLQYTGPLSYEAGEDRAEWEPVWYNTTGSCVKIVSLQVIHMNGKKLSFSGKALSSALSRSLKNSCASTAR